MYALSDFIKAVVEGKSHDGRVLETDMPRWIMEHEDIAALAEYLKTLD